MVERPNGGESPRPRRHGSDRPVRGQTPRTGEGPRSRGRADHRHERGLDRPGGGPRPVRRVAGAVGVEKAVGIARRSCRRWRSRTQIGYLVLIRPSYVLGAADGDLLDMWTPRTTYEPAAIISDLDDAPVLHRLSPVGRDRGRRRRAGGLRRRQDKVGTRRSGDLRRWSTSSTRFTWATPSHDPAVEPEPDKLCSDPRSGTPG